MSGKSISNEQVIKLVACHECCAYRGEPCTFARCDDPHGRRAYARKSHDSRVLRAKALAPQPINPLEIVLTL